MLWSSWRWRYVALAVALRLVLLGWGVYQDAHLAVPYTDVDYVVFNDGAHALMHGCQTSDTIDSPLFEGESDLLDVPEIAHSAKCARGFAPALGRLVLSNRPLGDRSASTWLEYFALSCYHIASPFFRFVATIGDPYSRPTYRYSPFFALLLGPAHSLGEVWRYAGKLLFAAADIGCALLMWEITDLRAERFAWRYPAFASAAGTHLPGLLWLINPVVAQISTRGSSDSVVGLFVLAFIALLLRSAPDVGLVSDRDLLNAESGAVKGDAPDEPLAPENVGVLDADAFYTSAFLLATAIHVKMYPVIYGASVLAHLARYRKNALRVMCGIKHASVWQLHRSGLKFVAATAAVYATQTVLAWAVWGAPYLDNALLYHITRKDHRHNFSVYFFPSYLSLAAGDDHGWLLRLATSPLASFAPQLITTAAAGFMLGGYDLVLGCAVQTVVFVAWNKVYTSQYFLWYLWFVPVIAVTMKFTGRAQVAQLVGAWVGAQALWLFQAYRLEMQGQDTFVWLWLSSLVLLAAQAWCTTTCVQAWSRWRAVQRDFVAKSE